MSTAWIYREEFAHLLQKAEQAMSSLDQARGKTETIAAWRSETIKALGKTDECKKMRNEQIQGMKDTLFRDVSILFTRRETSIRFYLQVLVPAAKLATTIQTSASKYAFVIQKSHPIQASHSILV
ncbi:hypothetical protein ABVK25_011219 [Lepraria finkii]|uniref:Uncharacterized protein n=1 Tax=Lepraria finkii TaxID=1340010 RepID=A0ABR4AWM3_9LECA